MLCFEKLTDPRDGHRAGRALLARMYRAQTGDPLPPIQVTDQGKPYFPDSPFHFSISHSKGHVFVALCHHPVGVDAEELDRVVQPKLAEKILSPGEMGQYHAAPDQNRALLTFWVLKEAQSKYTGDGLRGYPNHTDFSVEDPRVQEIDGCLVAVITG